MSSDVEREAERIAEAADRPAACGIRVMPAAAPTADGCPEAVIERAGRLVAEMGFVPLRPAASQAGREADALLHRHIAIFVASERERAWAIDWVRRLSIASARGHLVVRFDAAAPAASGPPVVQPPERVPVGEHDPRAARAEALDRRRRPAAARRWLVAAIESARRRGDGAAQAELVLVHVARLMNEGALDRACAMAMAWTRRAEAWPVRVRLAATAAQALAIAGELRRAEAVLAGISAEAALRGGGLPHVAARAVGEIYFWQGRFEEARAAFDRLSPAGREDAAAWRALTAWAWHDDAALGALVDADLSRRVPSLLALRHAMTGDADRTTVCVNAALAERAAPLLGARVDRAILAESLLTIGRRDAARGVLDEAAAARPGSRTDDMLLLRLRAACDDARSSGSAVRRFVDRTGARGLDRWGLGRTAMSVLSAVPALLQLVQDCDDELVTLKRGCAWMRRHAAAEAAAITAIGDARIIAADGYQSGEVLEADIREAVSAGIPRTVASPTQAIVATPVRYGGATIGSVVVRGRPEIAETLHDAAAALAALVGGTLRARLDAMAAVASGAAIAPEILGRSPAVAAVREGIARAAGTSFAVLIEGESGTGKELVARALHRLSARRDRRFTAINCAALTDELVEAELFGHARGAFTGAVAPRAGLFEDAHGGTIFLDEVGELSARAQAKLLRVLQEREIRRVGENVSRPVDVRVVAATNLPLAEAAAQGRFRQDLLFRLAVVRIRLPPLRERVEDVPLLAQAFWTPLMTETGKRAVLGPDALAELCRHGWPGNVRELQNALSGLAVAVPVRGLVRGRHVNGVLARRTAASPVVRLDAALAGYERQMVSAVLARHGGRRTTAARELGLTRQGLTKAIRRLGLRDDDGAAGVA